MTDKPTKPTITIPAYFALNGVKTDFVNDKLENGFDPIDPDVLAGDNLNKLIDDLYKAANYTIPFVEYLDETRAFLNGDNTQTFKVSDAVDDDDAVNKAQVTALLGLPDNYITGLVLSNNVSDANNDIDISAGKCSDDSNTIDMVYAGGTKKLDAIFAEGTNQGGLNTGTKAINTCYDKFLIAKADGTTDVMFSTFANQNTLPTGFIYKQYIETIRTDASGNILPFRMVRDAGGNSIIKWYFASDTRGYTAITGTTSSVAKTNITLKTPLGRKTRPLLTLEVGGTSASGYLSIYDLNTNDYIRLDVSNASDYNYTSTNNFYTNESSQISYDYNNGNYYLIGELGYINERVA